MKPVEVIDKYYKKGSRSRYFLIEHSNSVAKKALEVAKNVSEMKPDLQFIEEASMLHDIGIFLTNASVIGCFGDKEYICHGYLGRDLLEKEGYPKHGLACERHLGVGISLKEIEARNLPLPKRNMLPISLEEEIICFADKFFSKGEGLLKKEKSLEDIRKRLPDFGNNQETFEGWMVKFKCS